jgi:alpha-tubulin suppressor-like RCC1 family protein
VVAIAAANKHSAAVTSAGEVWTWGANASAQLGYGTSDSGCNPAPRLVEALRGKRLTQVAAAKHHTGGRMCARV